MATWLSQARSIPVECVSPKNTGQGNVPISRGERKTSYLKKTSQFKDLTKKETYLIDTLLLDDPDGLRSDAGTSGPEDGSDDQE